MPNDILIRTIVIGGCDVLYSRTCDEQAGAGLGLSKRPLGSTRNNHLWATERYSCGSLARGAPYRRIQPDGPRNADGLEL